MTDEQLRIFQLKMFNLFGFKVDVYHSEKHRGVLVFPHGKAFHPMNVIYQMSY